MELLFEKDNISYLAGKEFKIQFLSPIQKFVQWKLENNNWDDYNELYHAAKLIELLKKQGDIWFDSHIMMKNEIIVGVMFILGGKIQKMEKNYNIENEQNALLLKYFHIVEKGKGLGSFWMKEVVMPFYKNKLYKRIYINSSHEGSFSFYKKFGKKITEYKQPSDNDIYKRKGNCFEVVI